MFLRNKNDVKRPAALFNCHSKIIPRILICYNQSSFSIQCIQFVYNTRFHFDLSLQWLLGQIINHLVFCMKKSVRLNGKCLGIGLLSFFWGNENHLSILDGDRMNELHLHSCPLIITWPFIVFSFHSKTIQFIMFFSARYLLLLLLLLNKICKNTKHRVKKPCNCNWHFESERELTEFRIIKEFHFDWQFQNRRTRVSIFVTIS